VQIRQDSAETLSASSADQSEVTAATEVTARLAELTSLEHLLTGAALRC
jgi:hypothetical protein